MSNRKKFIEKKESPTKESPKIGSDGKKKPRIKISKTHEMKRVILVKLDLIELFNLGIW